MTYDAVGNIASTTNFNGEVITYEYDALNRLKKKILPNETFTMVYLPNGKLASVTDNRGTTTYSYDTRQRLTEQVDPDNKYLRYGYDAANSRTSVTTPSGATRYTYAKSKELQTVTDPNNEATTYTYDKAGNLIQTDLPNSAIETRTYDLLNRLTRTESKKNSTVLFSAAYTLDNMGMRTKAVENSRTVNYTYDNLYRLLSESDGTTSTSYTYSPTGNRLTKTTGGIPKTYTYDTNDRLLSDGTTTYTYDNNGNTKTSTTAGVTTSYTWDADNRLKATQKGSTNVIYDYDYAGIRAAQKVNGTETRYLVDKNRDFAQVLDEYAPGGSVNASYVYGSDLISQSRNGAKSLYVYDGLGSVRALTNSTGAVTDTYTYDAYGNLAGSTGSTTNDYRFAGEQLDKNLSQYYLRDRYYGADTGRFTQRDRFDGDLMSPLSLNRYAYAHGNPVNGTDPSGMFDMAQINVTLIIVGILATTAYLGYQIGRAIDAFAQTDSPPLNIPPGVGNASGSPITLSRNLPRVVAAVEIERCSVTGDTDCDTRGFPVVFYGAADLPEHAMHIFNSHIGFGNTLSWNISTPPFSAPRRDTGLMKPLPSFLLRKFPVWNRGWLDNIPSVNGVAQTNYTARTGNQPNRDEYPFGTTWEGGGVNYLADRVSVELVDRHESSRQGGLMSAFYTRANVVPNDPNRGDFGVVALPFRQVSSFWIDRNGVPGAVGW
jgi:RHS repeat-associated protein